jgi:hypothetical protein
MAKDSDRKTAASPGLYICWMVLSIAILVGARAYDPYVFGFAAFSAAFVSAVLVGLGLWSGLRPFAWALVAALPTTAALTELSTYRWN